MVEEWEQHPFDLAGTCDQTAYYCAFEGQCCVVKLTGTVSQVPQAQEAAVQADIRANVEVVHENRKEAYCG